MNKNSRRLVLYILLMILIATAAATLRTLAYINNMEDGLIYFGDETLAFASAIVAAAGVILLASSAIVLHKLPLKAIFSSPLTYIPTGAVCVAALSLVLVLTKSALTFVSYLPLGYAIREPLFLLNAISAILASLSVVHFLLTAMLTERHRAIRAYFSLGTILFACLYTATLYFDNSMPINAPTEIVDEMAYLSVAIFFLYEARISLGREMWRGYSVFGLIAALMTAYASIPELLVYFLEGKTLAHTLESSILLFSLFIFIFARLLIAATTVEDGEHSAISVLRSFAEQRVAELAEATKQRRNTDDIQISIDDIFGEPITDTVTEPRDDENSDESFSNEDTGPETLAEETVD